MRKIFFLSILLTISNICLAQQTIAGKVIDAETQEDLPFVTVKIAGTETGISTDASGNFQLSYGKKIGALQISSVGYETQEVKVNPESKKIENLIFRLKKTAFVMNEVRIVPGINPAIRIMKEAIKNRKIHNPSYLNSYTCETYTKGIFDITPNKDKEINPRALGYKIAKKLLKVTTGKHFMITESVSERKGQAVNTITERVLGTKFSGFSDPTFSVVPTTTQPFSIYDDYFEIINQQYYSPLAEGSIGKYFYNIEDTLYKGVDTVFVISYRPSRKSNFLGLKGVLQINTNGFAVQKATISPAIEVEKTGKVYFEQEYTLLDNKQWFPSSFYSEATYLGFPSGYLNAKVYTKSSISKVQINVPIALDADSYIENQSNTDATKKSDAFWQTHRTDSLATDEKQTYARMDSVRRAEHLDEKLKLVQSFVSYKYPIGMINLDLNRLAALNRYEGLRLGLGLHTNENLLKWFGVGGYYAYGLDDKQSKHGGDVRFFLNKKHEVELGYLYMNDIVEAANAQYFYPAPLFQNLAASRMDAVIRHEAQLHTRFFQYLTSNVSFRQETREPLYNYQYNGTDNILKNAELRIEGRYAYKEKLVQYLGSVISNGTTFPVISFAYVKGLETMGGNYNYNKFSLGIEKTFRNINLGETSVITEGGLVTGNTPYFTLFNGDGSFSTRLQLLYMKRTFQTMRQYEFVSDRYFAFFMRHKFGSVLHKFRTKLSKPEPVIYFNYGIGNLTDQNKQAITKAFNPLAKGQFITDFKTMDKGFYEVGFGLDNLLRFNYGNLVYLGVGTSVFVRVGNYILDKPYDNVVNKLLFTFSFN